MSSVQQERRDEYSVGDQVFVIRRAYAGKQSTHRGTVVEKHSAAALVRIDGKGGKPSHKEMVAWGKLMRCPTEAPILKAENTGKSTETLLRAVPTAFSNVKLAPPSEEEPELLRPKPAALAPQPVRVEPTVQAPVAQEVPATAAPSQSRSKGLKFDDGLTAYLDLGQSQLRELEAKQKDLIAIAAACDAEVDEMLKEAERKAEELVKEADRSRTKASALEKQILALRTLTELATTSLAVLAAEADDEDEEDEEELRPYAFSGQEQQASL